MTHDQTIRTLDLCAEILTELLEEIRAMNKELSDNLTLMEAEEIINQ